MDCTISKSRMHNFILESCSVGTCLYNLGLCSLSLAWLKLDSVIYFLNIMYYIDLVPPHMLKIAICQNKCGSHGTLQKNLRLSSCHSRVYFIMLVKRKAHWSLWHGSSQINQQWEGENNTSLTFCLTFVCPIHLFLLRGVLRTTHGRIV